MWTLRTEHPDLLTYHQVDLMLLLTGGHMIVL